MRFFDLLRRTAGSLGRSALRGKTSHRNRRLFLEPLEERRLLTFGWGSSTASGSYSGAGVTWGWGYDGGLNWPNTDTDEDGVYDSDWASIVASAPSNGFVEGEPARLALTAIGPYGWNWTSAYAEYWIENGSLAQGNGVAQQGLDFTDLSGSSAQNWQPIWVSTDQATELLIPTIDDADAEIRESIRVHLRTPQDPASETIMHLDIIDNDSSGYAQFTATISASIEGTTGLLLNVNSSIPLPFMYWVEDVSAQGAGVDYTDPGGTNQSNWASIDSTGQVIFPTVNDAHREPTESFRVYVTVEYDYATVMQLEADIYDDEPNNAPVAVNDSLPTAEDTPLTLAAPGILGNDTDADGDSLTSYYQNGPSHGLLTLHLNGSFTYTPNPNYDGSDFFTYYASDGFLFSNLATATVSITPQNDAPQAWNDDYSTPQNTTLNVAAAGILINDSDVEGHTLIAVLVANAAHGTLVLNPSGSFTYTPTAGYYGVDSFTYRANDSQLTSNVATVTLTIPQAFAPEADPDNYETTKNTPLTIAAGFGVLAGDFDANNDPLTAALVAGTTHGTLVLSGNGSFTYTPATGYYGYDSFTYRANDGTANSNVATVTLKVADPPDIAITSFTSDGIDFKIEYTVTGWVEAPYQISLAAERNPSYFRSVRPRCAC
jgi:VCBS repeat-containing protein